METLNFAQQITAPSGTPFGGPVTLEVHDNGNYRVHFDMKSTSILAPLDYTVRAYLTAPGFPTMAFIHAGHVDANDNDPHDESGHSPLLALYWPSSRPHRTSGPSRTTRGRVSSARWPTSSTTSSRSSGVRSVRRWVSSSARPPRQSVGSVRREARAARLA
jgi:hypothetical protein